MEQSLTSRRKTHEKKFGDPILGLGFFCHFLKFTSIVNLDIARNCSLRQCLTSSQTETKEKESCPKLGPNRPNQGWNDLFYSNVVGRPAKFACFLPDGLYAIQISENEWKAVIHKFYLAYSWALALVIQNWPNPWIAFQFMGRKLLLHKK